MTRLTQIQPEFVKFVPEVLESGVVYVSMEYATVVHACCCGCGNKVVTPLASRRWQLIFDGETISLNHSIGNWSFPCQSHYWIVRNEIIWDRPFSGAEIARVRAADNRIMQSRHSESLSDKNCDNTRVREPWWRRLLRRLRSGEKGLRRNS